MIALGMGGPSEQIDGKSGDCTFGSSTSLVCRATVVGLSSGERSGQMTSVLSRLGSSGVPWFRITRRGAVVVVGLDAA
jgi:hypothetical protein